MWQNMVLAKIILSEKDKTLTHNVSLLRGGISTSLAPDSPDLNPEDYNIWLEMWQLVCHRHNFITPKNWISLCLICGMAWSKASLMTFSVISWASFMIRNWWVTQTSLCMYLCNRTTLLAYSLFNIIQLQCFCLYILWKSEVHWRYCVKYIRI